MYLTAVHGLGDVVVRRKYQHARVVHLDALTLVEDHLTVDIGRLETLASSTVTSAPSLEPRLRVIVAAAVPCVHLAAGAS